MRVTLHRRPVHHRRPVPMPPRPCHRTPLDRSSTPWRDAIGAGFAVGATQQVIDLVCHEADDDIDAEHSR